MAEKKQSLLALLEILKQYSDEDHLLSIRDMQRHLKNGYGLDIERRTIYAHMDLLRQNGYEISSYDESGKGYYLQGRQFDKGEVLLLCNAVHASHFISARQSDQLVSKLLATQSRYQQQEYRDKVYLANPLKTPNRQLLYTIEIVSEAIRDGRQLQFTYLKYDDRKKLVARRQEPYIVEPRYIVYADSRAYMIVTSLKHPGFIHYRLDRMADARILNEKVRKLPKETDAYEYARNKLFMYAGEMEHVTFSCKEEILDQMIDIFGTDLPILSAEDGRFLIRVKTSQRGALFLAQQFLDSLSIVEPQDLKEEFRKQLQRVLHDYSIT